MLNVAAPGFNYDYSLTYIKALIAGWSAALRVKSLDALVQH